MISKKAFISTGATLAVVAGLTGVAAGEWGPQPKPPKTVVEAPLVINDVKTIHKVIRVKSKARPTVRPVSNTGYGSNGGTAYAASNPPQQAAQSQISSRSSAPTVSTHSSGGSYGGEGESEGRESENHSQEREGSDD